VPSGTKKQLAHNMCLDIPLTSSLL
jgi:hypothetical protein